MIGNDVIDLEILLSENWDTSRYLNKLFLPTEQEFIFHSAEPNIYLQLLWSLKEAAYKAHQRRFNLSRAYNPLQFSSQVYSETKNELLGKVETGNAIYQTSSIISKDYIHSIAREDTKDLIKSIFETPIDLKKEILLEYSRLYSIPIKELSIQKNENQIPFLYRNKLKLEIDFSFSHHGKFSAFILALTNS